LGLAFTCQRLDFFPGVKVWWYTAGGYAGLVVIHAVLIQRDGYCISLTHGCANVLRRCGLIPLAWIFEWIGASSARGPAEQYLMPYRLKTGWGSYLSNALFWIVVLGAKCVFDWYAVMQTMRLSVIALFDANWLGSVGWDKVVSDDPDIPPRWVPKETGFDLDIILCIGRVLPGFLVVMNDTQVGETEPCNYTSEGANAEAQELLPLVRQKFALLQFHRLVLPFDHVHPGHTLQNVA
jgi:hypothetical protein